MRIVALDACVLIDLLETGPDLLPKLARHFDRVIVPSLVLGEVGSLSTAARAKELGLEVWIESPDLLRRLGRPTAALSLADRSVIEVSASLGAVCVTNDRRLLRECSERGVPAMRTLRLLLELVNGKSLTASRARSIARRLFETSPRFAPRSAMDEFYRALERGSGSGS